MENRVSSIVILKQNAQSLKNAELFLGNRGWAILSVTQLKKMIVQLAQKPPEYLLIPVDFPHRKILVIPQLLTQAFPVKIAVYAEKPSQASIAQLQKINVPYKIYPPISGPAIERIIFKIQKETSAELERRIRSGQSQSDSLGNSEIEIRFRDAQDVARGQLTALLKDDGDEWAHGLGGLEVGRSPGTIDGSHTINESGIRGADVVVGPVSYESISPVSEESGGASTAGTNIMNIGRGVQGPNLVPGQYEQSKTAQSIGSLDSLSSGEGFESIPFYGDPNLRWNGDVDEQKSPGSKDSTNESERVEDLGWKPKDRSATEPVYRFRSTEKITKDTIMVRGTQKALQDSVSVKSNPGKIELIDKTKSAVCVIIESPRFSGYLVAVMGGRKPIDSEFVDIVRIRLFNFLKAHGETINENERAMEVKLEEIEFEAWALEQAEFLKKAVHQNHEIAMAFFPTTDTSLRLEQSAAENMFQVDIHELRDDLAVECDLYIYLPQNKKYLLYTPQGYPLYGSQRQRLIEKGVKNLHLLKESAHGMKRYRAQNFLNDKIQEFKENRTQSA